MPETAPPTSGCFEKELLRVGDWAIGGKTWPVRECTLRALARNCRRAHQRGVKIPLVWNHSADVRDRIGEAERFFVRGGALFAILRVPDSSVARQLQTTAGEVSIEVQAPFSDGLGNRYDNMVTHIGVVNFPVVPGQAPFEPVPPIPKGDRSMPEVPIESSTPLKPAPSEDAAFPAEAPLAALISKLNDELRAAGSTELLPEDCQLEDLARRLVAIVRSIREAAHEPAPETVPEPEEVRQLRLERDEARMRLAMREQREEEERKEAFAAALDRLTSEGRIAPADRSGLFEAAAPAGFRLSLLVPFERIPPGAAAPMRPLARRAADPNPSRLGARSSMTDNRAEEIARAFQR